MPMPERLRRLFEPELQPGEQVRAVANADLWLRYRRLALTDRRVLVVERGGVRRPRGGRQVTSLSLNDIASFCIRGGVLQHEVVFRSRSGAAHGYALPAISRATAGFENALRRALTDRERKAART